MNVLFILVRLVALALASIYLIGLLWYFGIQSEAIQYLAATSVGSALVAATLPRSYFDTRHRKSALVTTVVILASVTGTTSETIILYIGLRDAWNDPQWENAFIHVLFMVCFVLMVYEAVTKYQKFKRVLLD
jgi:hypothetical protein